MRLKIKCPNCQAIIPVFGKCFQSNDPPEPAAPVVPLQDFLAGIDAHRKKRELGQHTEVVRLRQEVKQLRLALRDSEKI